MSDYTEVTRHPRTGRYEEARWHDDHFGPHLYGVKFPDDAVIYPEEQVYQAQLKTFWAADVMEAFRRYIAPEDGEGPVPTAELLAFLDIQHQVYKERWERDPKNGEGAVQWFREMKDASKPR